MDTAAEPKQAEPLEGKNVSGAPPGLELTWRVVID
jgi:hypothetical protein